MKLKRGHRVRLMASITFRASWFRSLLLPVFLTVFVLVSLESGRFQPQALYFLAVFWLVAIGRLLYIFLRKGRDTFTVDADGFVDSRWKGKMRWENVERILSYPTSLNTYICFMLKGGQQPKSNRPWPSGLFDRSIVP